ncbi:MAG: hypothetical protein U0324_06555 [Polyangiales bacterium]
MIYECYTRIMVGLPLAQHALGELAAGFHASLGLDADAAEADALAALRDAAPRHKRNEPDRVRFEQAFEAWVDGRWDVDCAIAGVSVGGLDAKSCQVWVGVRVEQFEHTAKVEMPAQFVRPRALRKGDLTPGSDLAHALGPDARKQLEHAGRMYTKARLQIEGDAITRTKGLPVSRQHEVGWAMVRWLVPVKS